MVSPLPAPGPVALVGSGEYLPVMEHLERRLLEGRPPRFVQLATAAAPEGVESLAYWHELGRQVRFEGPVVRSPDSESDAYFATRPLASQINAWSSEQSRPLPDTTSLEERAARLAATRPAGLPRPEFWGGFRLWLEAIELWVEGRDRFHERVRYERRLDPRDAHTFEAGRWSWQRLQP